MVFGVSPVNHLCCHGWGGVGWAGLPHTPNNMPTPSHIMPHASRHHHGLSCASLPSLPACRHRRLNALDLQLNQHAQHLAQLQRQRLEASGKLERLPPPAADSQRQGKKGGAARSASGAKAPSKEGGITLDMQGAGFEGLDASSKQRVQQHVMQQLQQWLSKQKKSEWRALLHGSSCLA